MSSKPTIQTIAPEATRALHGLSAQMYRSGLEPSLVELMMIRASQINGCSFCIKRHSDKARALGESEQRLARLAAWRETPLYSEREQAALAWTEAVTLLAGGAPSAEVFAAARAQFGDSELVHLTFVIATINALNRVYGSFPD